MPQISLVYDTYDVVASPADDAEIVIARLSTVTTINPQGVVHLHGWVNLAPDADATRATIQIRRDSLTGHLLDSAQGVASFVAGDAPNITVDVDVFDVNGDVASATYVLCLLMENATDESGVNAVHLEARV